MGSLGISEIILILLIFLLLFGAGRLPALARGLGIAVRKFRGSWRDEGPGDGTGEGAP